MSQELNATHPSLHAVVDCQVLQVSQAGCGICHKQPAPNLREVAVYALSCAKVKKKSKLRLTSFWCNSKFCV